MQQTTRAFLAARSAAGDTVAVHDENAYGFPHSIGHDFIEDCGDGVADCGHLDTAQPAFWVPSDRRGTLCRACALEQWPQFSRGCTGCGEVSDGGPAPLWLCVPSPAPDDLADVIVVRMLCASCRKTAA